MAQSYLSLCSFLINNVISAPSGSESGFDECLSESVWPECPRCFPWCIRGVFYGTLAHRAGALIYGYNSYRIIFAGLLLPLRLRP